jgi:anti-sigma factor RsiW
MDMAMTSVVNCEDVSGLLDAFVDGELPAHERGMVAGHVRSCTRCSNDVEDRRALSTRLQTLGKHALPATLPERIAAAIAAEPDEPRSPWRGWRPGTVATHGVAAAAGALAVGIWLHAMPPQSMPAGAEREVVALHVRGLMQDQFRGVESGNPHAVRPWFAGKLSFAPPVTDLATAGFPLQGGRVEQLGGQPVAALLYSRRAHRITLLVAPLVDGPRAGGESTLRERGFNIVTWHDAAFSYRAVSDLNAGELATFAALLQGR